MPGATWRSRPQALRRASASRWGIRAVSSSDRPVAGSGKPPSPSAERRTILVAPGTAKLRIRSRSIDGPPAAAESSTAAGGRRAGLAGGPLGRAIRRPAARGSGRILRDRAAWSTGPPVFQPLDDARSAMPKATQGSEPIEALLKEGRKFPPPKTFAKAARVKSAGDLPGGAPESGPVLGAPGARSSGGSSRGGRRSSGSSPTRSGSSAGSSTSPTTAWIGTSRARDGTRPRSSGRASPATAAC